MTNRVRLLVMIALLAITTQLVLSGKTAGPQRGTQMIGKDRLVSIEPLPQTGAEICAYPENPQLIASLQPQEAALPAVAARPQQSVAAGSAATSAPPRPSDAARLDVAKRAPSTTIRDPRNAFSGMVVDPVRNEVIMSEENNFGIHVYDRLENTPPRSALSEPKRMIQGGNTFLEFACGVYLDPPTGDIYGINNDTLTWMTVFDRNAKGDAKPIRKLSIPLTSFGIVGDEETQELLMTVQNDHAVVTFKKTAKDHDLPVRVLQGPKTQMGDPHGITLDPRTGLIYVTNWGLSNEKRYGEVTPGAKNPWPAGNDKTISGTGKIAPPSITVYRKDAQGDVAPIRMIQGPKTLLNWPTSIAIHPDRGELFVANDTNDTVTVYRTDANGDVAPIRVLKGPRSMVKNPVGVAVDVKNNELWVANFGNHSATIYPIDATGDPTPKRVIRTARPDEASPMISNPHTVAYDSKRDQLLVAT